MSLSMHLAHRPVRLALAATMLVLAFAVTAGSARADFGFSSFTAQFQDPAGNPVTQAGAHADMLVDFTLNQRPDPETGDPGTDEQLKDIHVDLPPGFYGNPQATPKCSLGLIMANEGYCNPDAQVGFVELQLGPDPNVPPYGNIKLPVYNVEPDDDETAALLFVAIGVPLHISITPRTDGDYGLTATLERANQGLPIYRTKLTIWGVPADPAHDAERLLVPWLPGVPSGVAPKPFLTLPPRCEPVTITARANSWQHQDTWVSAAGSTASLTGCEGMRFEPRISARPVARTPDTPSGFDVDLEIPQDASVTGVGTPHLRKAVVTLPEGVAVSPSSAAGLEGCSDAQLALGSTAAPTCPDASKIGTVSITTPLLPDPLEGDIVLGTPKPGELFRLFLVARGPGMILKLPGVAQPNEKTGQLTATFDNTPQLPFSKLHLHFKSGPRAPLATPQSCGVKTTTTEMTSWAGPTATPGDSFEINGCTNGFAPTFEAGTVNPEAGAFSPFTMTIRRKDGDQELSGISVALPPGLLGILAGIPACPEAAAAAGTCDASTQLGTVTVESGAGDEPLALPGKVFLAGAYKGAPYSLAIVVRAVAGPFDLGTVVVRAPLNIDASGGKVAVPADPVPTILQGVPLRLRTISLTLDRPGFMFNATNCTTMGVGATLTSVGGTKVTPVSRYQALGCADLPLKPAFSIRLTGAKEMGKKGHPGVAADLSQTPGQSGLKQVEVPLPAGVSVDLKNLGSICKAADASARKCADSAIVGRASVKTPALPGTLSGPVYFVEGDRGAGGAPLPRLWLKLEGGGVPLDLWANTTIVGGRVISTFVNIPDAPISTFHLEIDGGPKGILQTARAQCPAARTSKAVFTGQNGRVLRRTVRFGTDCAPRIAKTKVGRSSVQLTVVGIGAGKLSVSGSGARRASRTVRNADVATITAKLSATAKRTLARKGSVRLRLAVTYKPAAAGSKGTTLRKTVTIRAKKR